MWDYFGFHSSQVAERVFDEKSDYNPLHSLFEGQRPALTLISKNGYFREGPYKNGCKDRHTPAPKKAETVPVDKKPKDEKQEDKKADGTLLHQRSAAPRNKAFRSFSMGV